MRADRPARRHPSPVIGIAVAVAAMAALAGEGWRRAGRSALTVCAAALAGFILSTLPIAPRYPEFIVWISRLSAHQGFYGAGPPGLSLDALARNASDVVTGHAVVFAALGLAILAIAAAAVRERNSRQEHAGHFAVALGLAVQGVVLTLAIFKLPGSLYVLSLAALVPILMAIAFSCWRSRGGGPARAACLLFAALVVVRFLWLYPDRLRAQRNMPLVAARALERVDSFLRQRADGAPGIRVWTTGTESPCFALWLPNVNTGRAFSAEIAARCPGEGMAWYHLVEYPETWRDLDPASVSAVLVTVRDELEAEPTLLWGKPVRTNIASLFQGPYVIIPFPLDRLPPAGAP